MTAPDGRVAGESGLPTPRRYWAIAAASLGTILTTVDGSIVNVALPTLSRDLGVAPSATVLVVTVYQLVMMMGVLPFAALGERLGLARAYRYGMMVFIVATLLCFFARSLPFLVLVRGFQAVGAAAVLSVSTALIRHIYPASSLGRGLSLNTVIAATAASVAPSVGGAILAIAPWPFLFVGLIPFCVLSLLIGWRSLPETPRHTEPYDVVGAILCAATFGVVVVGLESAVHGDSPVISAALVASGVALGIVFVRHERGQARPVLPVDLLANVRIALSTGGLLAGYIASMIALLALPIILQQRYGYGAAETGAVMAAWPLVILFVGPIAGSLSDKIATGVLGGIGTAFATISFVLLAWLPDAPSHADFVWRMALSGLGFGLFFSPGARQIVGSAPLDRAAAAGGLTSTIRGAGQTFGSTTMAALLAAGLGFGRAPFLVSAGLTLIAAITCVVTLRPMTGNRDRKILSDI